MTKDTYSKILSDGLKGSIDKMDPQMIFSLAKDIISSYNNLKEMKIKGQIFLAALKEHEKTVRFAMQKHSETSKQVISALERMIEKTENKEEKMECLRALVTFGSESLEKLHITSRSALNSIPQLPGRSEK